MKIRAPHSHIEFEVDKATLHYFPAPVSGDPVDVDPHDKESIEQAAEHLGTTPEMVEALAQSIEYLKDRLRADLIDILYEANPNRQPLV